MIMNRPKNGTWERCKSRRSKIILPSRRMRLNIEAIIGAFPNQDANLQPLDAPTITLSSTRFMALPKELRLSIYSHSNALAKPASNKLPSLLLAFWGNKQLFDKAYEEYKRLNVLVTTDNVAEFKQMRLEDLLKYKHLKVNLARVGPELNNNNGSSLFRGHAILHRNNFESVTFVLKEDWKQIQGNAWLIVNSSRGDVKRLVVKFPREFCICPKQKLQPPTKLWGVRPELADDYENGEDRSLNVVWVWEREDGSSLMSVARSGV